ncbi:hypothetical protein [Sphingomonas swuensis]
MENQTIAAKWAEKIAAQCAAHPDGERAIPGTRIEPFAFLALSDLAPVTSENWTKVVEQQRLLVAEEILGALHRLNHAAHLTEQPVTNADHWVSIALKNIRVQVNYRGYDLSDDGDQLYDVEFDLMISVRRD